MTEGGNINTLLFVLLFLEIGAVAARAIIVSAPGQNASANLAKAAFPSLKVAVGIVEDILLQVPFPEGRVDVEMEDGDKIDDDRRPNLATRPVAIQDRAVLWERTKIVGGMDDGRFVDLYNMAMASSS
eukprot:CAMPEP_0113303780 /NCGR_PEP_ID=MMETSP0010_2-20120614/4052_1 /TAXON_ID=216773 ORGANISM="Corethron hystrix, Strain 308" /NCGR_SAMPLE_ID=MMETSP0010_2 /ASSEMBLY_ACC=CAM_ASM_000155 /LENGTH=127 /DNA_ID=CAMNT_0000157831 /DNA_START=1049 /DNA_END=1432 /DNA_ORIENTATION=- /assembly_acc=CAM_ASM_000155